MPELNSHRVSRRLVALQKLMLLVTANSDGAHDIEKTRRITRTMESLQRHTRGVQETTAMVAGVPVRWFRPARTAAGLIFHVHGGAFVAGSSLAARAHSELARSQGVELVSVDYRLARASVSAGLDDLWAVYLRWRATDPRSSWGIRRRWTGHVAGSSRARSRRRRTRRSGDDVSVGGPDQHV